jgi:hypothetical protein
VEKADHAESLLSVFSPRGSIGRMRNILSLANAVKVKFYLRPGKIVLS